MLYVYYIYGDILPIRSVQLILTLNVEISYIFNILKYTKYNEQKLPKGLWLRLNKKQNNNEMIYNFLSENFFYNLNK